MNEENQSIESHSFKFSSNSDTPLPTDPARDALFFSNAARGLKQVRHPWSNPILTILSVLSLQKKKLMTRF